MNFNNLNQQEINNYFVEACSRGDLPVIKQLYNSYRPYSSNFNNSKVRKIHNSFFNLFSSNRPSLKVHYDGGLGLKKACENGYIDVVKFVVSLPDFSSPINSDCINYAELVNRTLTECLEVCLYNKQYKIADLLLPLAEHTVYFEFTMQHNFLKACLVGEFENVRYMLTSPHLEKYRHSWLNGTQHEFGASHQGFIYACENGHLKIVEYLTSSYELQEHVDINLIEKTVRIKNEKVLHYLISRFNLHKEHPFVPKIEFFPQSHCKLNSLLEKHNSIHKQYRQG